MRWRGYVAVLLMTVALAGCSDGGTAPPTDDARLEIPEAKEGLGVILGVVVDDSITPVPEATVFLERLGLETQTGEDGTFSFVDVEPGIHFLTVSKPGYFEVQQSAEVQADVEPKTIKVLLEVDAESMPHVQELVFNGFIECSTTYLAACSVPDIVTDALGQPSLTNDDFIVYHDLEDLDPDWVQTELVWESTQSVSDRLWLWHSHGSDGGFTGSFDHTTGASPLMIVTEPDDIEAEAENPDSAFDISDWQLVIRVFSGDIEGTTPPQCVVFCNGPGVAINQEFQSVSHLFYNYQPPEGWRFTEAAVPEP